MTNLAQIVSSRPSMSRRREVALSQAARHPLVAKPKGTPNPQTLHKIGALIRAHRESFGKKA